MSPDELFICMALHCTLPARVCAARQAVSEMELTRDRNRGWRPRSASRKAARPQERGESTTFPLCVTAQCAQGRHNLLALVKHQTNSVKHGQRSDLPAQYAARVAWEAEHPEIPTLDGPPPCALLGRDGARPSEQRKNNRRGTATPAGAPVPEGSFGQPRGPAARAPGAAPARPGEVAGGARAAGAAHAAEVVALGRPPGRNRDPRPGRAEAVRRRAREA